jgi:two-component system alkaline phosphatase synthesis response regulator PhoP
MSNKKVLIVDDETDILEFLKYNLEKSGYTIETASNGKEAVMTVNAFEPDLVLLDVMMPEMDGMEACRTIREEAKVQPIIAFLTSRSEDYSQIAGFDAGADDYITKPIRPRVLASRVEALLRRKPLFSQLGSENDEANQKIKLDKERFLLIFEEEEIQLPKKEFELLDLLLTKPGKVFTRDEILSQVWGNDTIVGERTIDVHIRKLREKIGGSSIRTIKGVGYTLTH